MNGSCCHDPQGTVLSPCKSSKFLSVCMCMSVKAGGASEASKLSHFVSKLSLF